MDGGTNFNWVFSFKMDRWLIRNCKETTVENSELQDKPSNPKPNNIPERNPNPIVPESTVVTSSLNLLVEVFNFQNLSSFSKTLIGTFIIRNPVSLKFPS